jgi:DNA replication ATP-dependent helicase Dna2
VRISQNSPESHYFRGKFFGLTEKGLTVSCSNCDQLDFEKRTGWSLDEELIDVSHFYLKGLKALAEEAHGRENVYPVLFEERPAEIYAETYDEVYDELDESQSPLNEPQKDAVATALAASPMHLIQGPPGTGKTQTLARLVERLVMEGHRVLVSGFTHRSIHQALLKIHEIIGNDCSVVKISAPVIHEDLPFPVFASLAESELDIHAGPYVIGATPFALYTKRLSAAHFDSAVLDETSQLTLPAAILAMMRSDRWFFFGDDKQLPPVTLRQLDDVKSASVFARLKKQTDYSTLNITYRMNQQLTVWPSEHFYHGELEAYFPDQKFNLKSEPERKFYREILSPRYSLVSVKVSCSYSKSRNDDEADLVAGIIEELMHCGVSPEDIGVVSPFRAQASRVRTLLRSVISPIHQHIERSITVDTVDRFQGQEREVILYTFTASDDQFIRKLAGFLLDQARINVAVTRARTKVILIYSDGLLDFAQANENHDENCALFLSLIANSHSVSISSDMYG